MGRFAEGCLVAEETRADGFQPKDVLRRVSVVDSVDSHGGTVESACHMAVVPPAFNQVITLQRFGASAATSLKGAHDGDASMAPEFAASVGEHRLSCTICSLGIAAKAGYLQLRWHVVMLHEHTHNTATTRDQIEEHLKDRKKKSNGAVEYFDEARPKCGVK